MAEMSIRQRQSTLVSARGFTLLELLVTSVIGLVIVAMALSTTLTNRHLYKYDLIRTRLNQNLRSGLDIIGMDAREAGENLFATFPAIEIIDGVAGAPDELIIRRNLLDEVFNICQAINAGSNNVEIYVADDSITQAGCDKTSNLVSYNTWLAKRTDGGGIINAYAYNRAAKVGEYIKYTSEQDNPSDFRIVRNAGTWINSYPVGSSSLYVLEEWRYRIQDKVLQIITDQDNANPLNVVDSIDDFQVRAIMQDGTVRTTFIPGDDWTDLMAVEVTMTGSENGMGENISRTISSRFFPRNILSN